MELAFDRLDYHFVPSAFLPDIWMHVLALLGEAGYTARPVNIALDLEELPAGPPAPLAEVDTGGTAFQRDVWSALRQIPCGETTSYGAMAKSMGRPGAARAVGITNGRNPVALVLPCHRVIGADGSLTGYAGGIERKRWLLRHEGALPATLI